MCGGPDCLKNKPSTAFVRGLIMENKFNNTETPYSSILLELSASDDLIGFKQAVEEDGSAIDEAGYWYGQGNGSRKMGMLQRTPLMIAAMFGSIEVIKYIISAYTTCGMDINRASSSDGATALHCAAAGGYSSTAQVVKLLLEASADVNAVDLTGNRPGDMIATSPKLCNSRAPLEKMLNVATKVDTNNINSLNREIVNGFSEEQHQGCSQSTKDGNDKKEYPIDLSLPDIKNGMYVTDEFRMYSFKVKPCSRAYSHDWTECPFVHPGENARRRDPRKYHYSCMPCPDFRKGACRRGDACEYAHGVFECWLHPAQYRTRLCKDETSCTRRVCFFAHTQEELRPLYPSTGSAMLSPRSIAASLDTAAAVSPLALGAPSVLMLPSFCSSAAQGSVSSTPPMSPSAAAAWQNQTCMIPPTLNSGIQGSRLKAGLSARDVELEELAGLAGQQQQQKLIDGISGFSSLSSQSSRINAMAAAAALANSTGSRSGKYSRHNLEEAYASDLLSEMGGVSGGDRLDPSMISQFQGLSLKTAAAVAAASAAVAAATASAQFQSPAGIQMRQSLNQLHNSYGLPPSPVRGSGFGLDVEQKQQQRLGLSSTGSSLTPALAVAVMNNSRASTFAKRSQSFCDRGQLVGSLSPGHNSSSSTALADWGSPTGKLDWGVQGEELNKLRKSASFGFRSSSSSPPVVAQAVDEPDVSWVQSLVKDGPAVWPGLEELKQEQLSSWVEQLYMEQEQLVA